MPEVQLLNLIIKGSSVYNVSIFILQNYQIKTKHFLLFLLQIVSVTLFLLLFCFIFNERVLQLAINFFISARDFSVRILEYDKGIKKYKEIRKVWIFS